MAGTKVDFSQPGPPRALVMKVKGMACKKVTEEQNLTVTTVLR